MIKVRNFQALIDNNYKHTQKEGDPAQYQTDPQLDHFNASQQDGMIAGLPNFDINNNITSLIDSRPTHVQQPNSATAGLAQPFADPAKVQTGPTSLSPIDQQKLLVISNHNSGNDSSSSGHGSRLHVARSETQPIFKVEKVSSNSNGTNNSNGQTSEAEDNKFMKENENENNVTPALSR